MDHLHSTQISQHVFAELRRQLLALARREETLAAESAARFQYWQPRPLDVVGHSEAARALRAEIARLDATAPVIPVGI